MISFWNNEIMIIFQDFFILYYEIFNISISYKSWLGMVL